MAALAGIVFAQHGMVLPRHIGRRALRPDRLRPTEPSGARRFSDALAGVVW